MSDRFHGFPRGYEGLLEGWGSNAILCSEAARERLQRTASADQRAELGDLLRRFCESGVSGLPSEKWDGDLGWFPSEDEPGWVQLVAVRASGLAAYGFTCNPGGRLTLVITGVDAEAKKTKSRGPLRDAAADEAFRMRPLIERRRRDP